MPSRHQESHERGHRLRVFEGGPEEVGLHVMHRHQRPFQREGRRLGPAQPHQQRPDQPRPGRHRHGVHVREGRAGLPEGGVHHRLHPAQVGPGRQLGHHAPVHLMDVLGEDHVPQELVLPPQHGGGRLVAARLQTQHQGRAHRKPPPDTESTGAPARDTTAPPPWPRGEGGRRTVTESTGAKARTRSGTPMSTMGARRW